MFRSLRLIAKTLFIESTRRKEIYGVVLLTALLIGWGATFHFFNMPSLHKFYQEVALKVMSVATMVMVIVLASRQLPREFEARTIYTVLAKPVSRLSFLGGKFLGVVAAGSFCLGLFMAVFLVCNRILAFPLSPGIFLQYVYLQFLLIVLAASLAFALSLAFNQDAAITLAGLIFIFGQIFTNTITIIQDYVSGLGRIGLLILNYIVPQPALFDLSSKVVHGWPPVAASILAMLTAYTCAFSLIFLGTSYLMFRRRSL